MGLRDMTPVPTALLVRWGLSLCCLFRVILCLGVPEFVVFAVYVCKQAVVGTLLDHAAFVEHGDLIAELAGRQAVTDVDCRLVTGDVIEFGVDLCFGDGVQGRCRLVQDDKRTAHGQ